MGGLRAGAETQTVGSPASPAGPGERNSGSAARRRWTGLAACLLSGAVLFTAYLRLSETASPNSDSANILLMGSDLLHGHLLLHGWYMSDVSFFPTELPQYALLESFLGLHMQTAHVAAAMTYTLVFLLAVALARSGSSGRAATVRTLIAAGIMLAPQFGPGVFALDLSVGHIGTAAPLLLIWLLLDRAGPGGRPPGTPRSSSRGDPSPRTPLGRDPSPRPPPGYVPVLTAVLLAWALVADPIVYVVGIGPLGAVCAARVIRGFATAGGRWTSRLAGQWYDLALGAATVAATGLAWVANNLISALGGYTVNRLGFYLTPWQYLHDNWQAGWKLLTIFGANYTGLGGTWLALAFLHMASVLVVAWALVRAFRRFFAVSLVDQVLAVAIVLNVVLYVFTNASDQAAHEVAIIAPFGAALAARVLVRTARPAGAAPRGRRRRVVRVAACAAGIAVLAGCAAGFGYELTRPSVPPANTGLASWLARHHLTYGLSGYWTSSSVTVEGGNRVQVRALMQYTLRKDLWMSNAGWYDPSRHYANFVVLDSQPGFFSHWEPVQLIRKYFGVPARTYHTGPYTILVWNKNLLQDIPGRELPAISPGQLSPRQLGHYRLRPGQS